MDKTTLIAAASYAGLGLVAFARPSFIPDTMGGSADNFTARSEVRAVYGGMPLAAAALLVSSPGSRRSIGAITASFALGRIASCALEKRAPDLTNAILMATEGGLAAALLRQT
jgi:hypothetical protein